MKPKIKQAEEIVKVTKRVKEYYCPICDDYLGTNPTLRQLEEIQKHIDKPVDARVLPKGFTFCNSQYLDKTPVFGYVVCNSTLDFGVDSEHRRVFPIFYVELENPGEKGFYLGSCQEILEDFTECDSTKINSDKRINRLFTLDEFRYWTKRQKGYLTLSIDLVEGLHEFKEYTFPGNENEELVKLCKAKPKLGQRRIGRMLLPRGSKLIRTFSELEELLRQREAGGRK